MKIKSSRKRRILRVRKKLKGTAEKPRLSIYKSNKNLYAQLIDDEKSISLGGVSSKGEKKSEAAKILGKKIAELAKEKNVKKIVFDRGRFKYHGIIKLFAEAAREGGLEF